MRKSGVLLPVASLPSEYGIGCFSKEAYRFIDLLKEAGQACWQILPLGPTSYGDSPYQSFSTFAGNPYFIDPGDLIERGWITKEECDGYDFGEDRMEEQPHFRGKGLSEISEREPFLAGGLFPLHGGKGFL